MAILEVENLKKSFDALDVLKGISFSLNKGEALSIIGSSGSGKTTMLRCLNFLEMPSSGRITVNTEAGAHVLFDDSAEKKLTDAEIRKNRLHFGLVFQSFNLIDELTVEETKNGFIYVSNYVYESADNIFPDLALKREREAEIATLGE